jgi:hypothetical protein
MQASPTPPPPSKTHTHTRARARARSRARARGRAHISPGTVTCHLQPWFLNAVNVIDSLMDIFVAQQPFSVVGCLIIEISRSLTIRHTNPLRLLCTSDRLITEAATYTTNTRDEHPYPQRVSNPRFQQSSSFSCTR